MNGYVFQCAGCGLLDMADRRDVMTCSSACRVKAHRSGSAARLRRIAETYGIPPALIRQTAAVELLRPDLAQQVKSGAMPLYAAMPAACAELTRRALAQADGCNASGETFQGGHE
ncbi:MAG: hypothetical protein IPG77_14170 [Betaproteobacteria bacterium]|nr:hypothetical protein [Betaproteobacteria bacterium]